MLQTAVNIVFDTGRMENVPKALGIGKTAFYRWMKENEELRNAVARAREDHKKLKERAFRSEISAAIEGLSKLLLGYEYTVTDKETERLRDDDGKVLKVTREKERERTMYIRPDMRAIEKVLGPNDLRHNLYLKALEEHVLNRQDELYHLVFGKLGVGEEVEDFKGIYVLHVQVDLLKIRYMEAHVQGLYDRGDLTVEQYIEFTTKLRRDYGQIMDRMEQRAQKLLQGKSYAEIIMSIEELWRVLIETVSEEMGKPITLKGEKQFQIPANVRDRVCENIVRAIHDRQESEFFAIKQLPRP